MSVELGKDGAYLEINIEKMDDVIESIRFCKPFDFKMLTILCQRIEISDPKYINAVKNALGDIIDSNETEHLDNKQIGFYVFKKIFEKGLEHWSKE